MNAKSLSRSECNIWSAHAQVLALHFRQPRSRCTYCDSQPIRTGHETPHWFRNNFDFFGQQAMQWYSKIQFLAIRLNLPNAVDAYLWLANESGGPAVPAGWTCVTSRWEGLLLCDLSSTQWEPRSPADRCILKCPYWKQITNFTRPSPPILSMLDLQLNIVQGYSLLSVFLSECLFPVNLTLGHITISPESFNPLCIQSRLRYILHYMQS